VPDDERLGGTRDEYGRRHRRGEAPPPATPSVPENQPRRRRRSVESGGVSVADLVQRHTGSRPDLTPVNPEQLRQNGVMTGRRARHEDQTAPPPPGPPARPAPEPPRQPSIAAALAGSEDFPQDRPPRPAPQPENAFPRDESTRRPGGQSSYFTIPSDALRETLGADDPGYQPDYPEANGYPAPEPPGPARRPRRAPRPAPETSGPHNGFPTDPGFPGGPADNGFPLDPGQAAHHGTDAPPGFPPGTPRRNGARRGGNPAPERNGFPEDGGPQNGFPPDAAAPPRRTGSRRARAEGFPPDPEAPRGGETSGPFPGPRRAGEASGQHPVPGEGSGPRPRRNGTPGDLGNAFGGERRNRRGEAPNGEPGPTRGRRRRVEPPFATPGEAPAPLGEPPFADEPPRGRRPGEASTHFGAPAEAPFADEAPRGRRPGEASTHFGAPAEAPFADEGSRGRHPGEASAHFAAPGDPAFGEASPRSRRAGEAPAHFGDDPRQVGEGSGPRSRRAGEAFATPGEPSFDDGPRQAGRPPFGDDPRPGEGSGPRSRRPRPVGEGSGPRGRREPGGDRRPAEGFGAPGDRPGEASFGAPGFPPDGTPGRPEGLGRPEGPGRPEGAARRRAARAATSPPAELGPRPGRFPTDPPPGQASGGRFPVDEFRRQGPPDELSEPRLTPAAIDAPDSKPRRSTGVPAVPPPPPPMGDDDLVTMTTEMEAIGDEVQKRRTIDHTLARFSAVHDEIKAEEREKKAKRRKLRPWERDDEMDRLDELEAQQSMAMAVPNLDPREEEEEEKKAKKKRRWRKGKIAGKAFAIFFAGMVFLSTAVAWGFKSYIEASAMQVNALDPDSAAIKDAQAQLGDENFLLVGSDTRAGATAEDGVGDDKEVVGARSDTVMIAHVPKNRERVVVVSFPRDLEVTRPACEGWDPKTGNYTGEQHPEAKRVKLNTAYQMGGPLCVTKLIQNLSGLAINHFVGIDFHGFKDMVDAVQGVEVCVERPMKDDVLGVVIPEAGKNVKLTGDQALNFVRARHVEGDKTSDYGRIIRQQRFLSSLLRKAMSGEVLLNPGKLTKFVDAFSKATFGDNIGVDQLFTLGQSMQGVAAGRVTFITVPTVGIENERHNEDLRVEDSNALFEAIRQDVPLPGEAPKQDDASQKTQVQAGLKQDEPKDQPGPVDPRTVKIQVLNGGNERGGIAGDTADELSDLGFDVVQVNPGPQVDRTIIKYSKSRAAQAQTLQAAVPGATLVEDPSVAGAILLIIGPDFDGKVQSPTGGGPVPEVPDNLSTVNAGDVSCA
jgi:LCP family protein required for cell wall assembly